MHIYWGLVILCFCLLSDKGFRSSDVPPETRARRPKCKNPNGEIGNTFRKGCFYVSCKKKGKNKAKWVERKVKNCCSLDGKIYRPGQNMAKSPVKVQWTMRCVPKGKGIAETEIFCDCPSTTSPTSPPILPPNSTNSTTDGLDTALLYLGPGASGRSSEIYSLDDKLSDVECFIPDYPEDIGYGMVGFVLHGVLTNCGGKDNNGVRLASCFSLINFNWIESASMSVEREAAASVTVGDKIWVAGGRSNSGHLSSIEVFDGDSFTSGTTMPYKAQNQCMTYIPGFGVLLAGGWDDTAGRIASTYLYTPTAIWTQMASMSIPRDGHACSVHQGKVWVGGSFNGDSVEVYTPSTNQWAAAGKLPFNKVWPGEFISHSGHLYLAGGGIGDGHDPKNIYQLNEDEDGWTKIREMESSRNLFPAVIISETECYGVSYSDDLRTALVVQSMFANIFTVSRMINEIEVQCCEDGVLSPTVKTCGTAIACESICGEKHSGDVKLALTEDAIENPICKADSAEHGRKRRLFSIPIYRLWYCPSRVRTVATLSSYPICCLHPTVWRRPKVSTTCCGKFGLCV